MVGLKNYSWVFAHKSYLTWIKTTKNDFNVAKADIA